MWLKKFQIIIFIPLSGWDFSFSDYTIIIRNRCIKRNLNDPNAIKMFQRNDNSLSGMGFKPQVVRASRVQHSLNILGAIFNYGATLIGIDIFFRIEIGT